MGEYLFKTPKKLRGNKNLTFELKKIQRFNYKGYRVFVNVYELFNDIHVFFDYRSENDYETRNFLLIIKKESDFVAFVEAGYFIEKFSKEIIRSFFARVLNELNKNSQKKSPFN